MPFIRFHFSGAAVSSHVEVLQQCPRRLKAARQHDSVVGHFHPLALVVCTVCIHIVLHPASVACTGDACFNGVRQAILCLCSWVALLPCKFYAVFEAVCSTHHGQPSRACGFCAATCVACRYYTPTSSHDPSVYSNKTYLLRCCLKFSPMTSSWRNTHSRTSLIWAGTARSGLSVIKTRSFRFASVPQASYFLAEFDSLSSIAFYH